MQKLKGWLAVGLLPRGEHTALPASRRADSRLASRCPPHLRICTEGPYLGLCGVGQVAAPRHLGPVGRHCAATCGEQNVAGVIKSVELGKRPGSSWGPSMQFQGPAWEVVDRWVRVMSERGAVAAGTEQEEGPPWP